MDTFKLEIVTPDGAIFSGDVKSALFPGDEGEFEVLPQHASLLTLLAIGVVNFVKPDGVKESVVINSGHVEVSENHAIALVEGAVALRGDSESAVATALNEARQLIADSQDSNIALAAVEAKIESAAKSLF